jgi:hypothetical protein
VALGKTSHKNKVTKTSHKNKPSEVSCREREIMLTPGCFVNSKPRLWISEAAKTFSHLIILLLLYTSITLQITTQNTQQKYPLSYQVQINFSIIQCHEVVRKVQPISNLPNMIIKSISINDDRMKKQRERRLESSHGRKPSGRE